MPQPLGHRVLAEGKGIEPLCGHPQPWLSKPAHYHSGSPPTLTRRVKESNPQLSHWHGFQDRFPTNRGHPPYSVISWRRRDSNPQPCTSFREQDDHRPMIERSIELRPLRVTARIRTGTSAVTVRHSAIELQPPSMRIIPIACFRPTRTAPDSYCPSLEVTDHVSV